MGAFGHGNYNKPSYYKAKKEPDSLIPPDVLQAFDENDIPKVWNLLGKVFHLNVKHWKLTFEYELGKASRDVTKMEVFYRFCKTNFEKPINVLRGNGMIQYLIKFYAMYYSPRSTRRRMKK